MMLAARSCLLAVLVASMAATTQAQKQCCAKGSKNGKCQSTGGFCNNLSTMAKPVCGCDGKTYNNAQCAKTFVTSWKTGSCKGSPSPSPSPSPKKACGGADATKDGKVDIEDLLKVLENFGKTGKSAGPADLNSSGKVDIEDLLLLLQNYGAANCKSAAKGKTYKVHWTIKKYKDVKVAVGDSVLFTYHSSHDLHLHPSGTCNRKGSKLIGKRSDGKKGVTYKFTKPGKYTFACQVGRHCDSGQIVTYIVGGSSGSSSADELKSCCKNGVKSGKCVVGKGTCNRMYRPVCGCDGKTYSNAGCAGLTVKSSKNGGC